MIEKELVYKIKGIIFNIYNNIVGSWSEEDYENILSDELLRSGLRVERQKEFNVFYKGHRVGLYRTDLIVENKIILELKAVPEILSLHQAQVISYLKVTGLKLAILINFGGPEVYIKVFPSKFITADKNNLIENSFKRQLKIDFDISKLNISKAEKELINLYLIISKDILEILGPGYFHQVYRRSFWDELKHNNINFKWINLLELAYRDKIYNKKDVKFFKINNLLVSIIAVNGFNQLILNRFAGFVKYYQCSKGLIINFNSTFLDVRIINRIGI